MVNEQSAKELLETLNKLISRARKTRFFHVLLGVLFLAAGTAILVAPPFALLESSPATPIAVELLFLGALIIAGTIALIARRIVEVGDRLNYERETKRIIEGILEDDPEVSSPFNRDIMTAIIQGFLYE